jgi:hypothetical protein
MPDSDAFIISAHQAASPADAIRGALTRGEVPLGHVQDAVFGLERSSASLNVEEVARQAGLACPAASVSSSLRAVFFAAGSILSWDADLVIVACVDQDSAVAILLASPDAVGRWNLPPRARLAVRSLSGAATALRAAGIASEDISVSKGDVMVLAELLDELEAKPARWGLIESGGLALLVERI